MTDINGVIWAETVVDYVAVGDTFTGAVYHDEEGKPLNPVDVVATVALDMQNAGMEVLKDPTVQTDTPLK